MKKIVITSRKHRLFNWKEVYTYRDLFFALAFRDLKVRYAQTLLGVAWVLLQPLVTLTIFIIVFDKAVGVDTGSVPYPLFALSGISLWAYFSFILTEAGNAIIIDQEMIKKVYFPRIIMPLYKAAVGFVDFGIHLLFLSVVLIYYHFVPSQYIFLFPVFIFMLIIAGLATGIWISALTIRYRDLRHIVPFIVQVGLYASPVAYPIKLIPAKFLFIYYLNPMAGLIEGFRWSLFGGELDKRIFISLAVLVFLFVSSLYYFSSLEKKMADIV